jgi:CheY-like chemotaxis protein
MARILHVDDLHEWREVVGRALADHHVDVAGSYDEALDLLQSGAAYDLALVDLHLVPGQDDPGGELLELLRARYPDTRRIVVAALPPDGALRVDLVEKYGVEEVLIRSAMDAPELRHVVEDALEEAVSVDARIRRAELRRRSQDWQRRQGALIESRIHAADLLAGTAGSDSRAQSALEDARALRERFRADCADLADRIDRSVTIQQVLDAADAFEHVEGVWADLVGR